MNDQEQLDIEQLVSSIADEGASALSIAALDDLLRDRADLQHYYLRYLQTHLLLARELSMTGGRFAPLVEGNSASAIPATDATCTLLARRIDADLQLAHFTDAKFQRIWWMGLALGLSAVAAIVWSQAGGMITDRVLGARDSLHGAGPDISAASLVVEDSQAMATIGRLSRTAAPWEVHLPATQASAEAASSLCSGTAWLRYDAGRYERGHVLALPAGVQMDVYIDTDASSTNTLSVVELDAQGRATGANYSVSNRMGESPSDVRSGWIGEFSQSNSTLHTRYFLFTASHMVDEKSGRDVWFPSDFRVYFDNDDVSIIGWDDNGFSSNGLPSNGDATGGDAALDAEREQYDYDYNDIRMTIRFSRLDGTPLGDRPGTYRPQPNVAQAEAEHLGTGFTLDVAPGREAYLMVSSYAGLQNSIRIVEVDTRRIIWEHDGSADPTAAQPTDRGIYIIRNDSDVVRRYELQARFRRIGKQTTAWRNTVHKLLADTADGLVVGFEDNLELPANIDWQDMLVRVYWFQCQD